MRFDDYRREILQGCLVCGGDTASVVFKNERKASQVIAAAAIVASERGAAWCADNPQDFIEETLGKLSFWIKVVMFIAGIFMGGSSIWFVIAQWVLPVVIDWLVGQQAAGVCGAAAGDDVLSRLAGEATTFLNGEFKP